MSKQNKFAGSFGKVGGDKASGGSKVEGSNVYKSPEASPQPKSSSSVSDNIITQKWSPGDSMGMKDRSTHNDINAFTRGIKSRGPYGGPSFRSINNSYEDMQKTDTSSVSKFKNPTGK